MKLQPPTYADRFLNWFCRDELIEDLQGDLHELFAERISEQAEWLIRLQYYWWVIRSIRHDVIKNPLGNMMKVHMLRNNLKIASRIIWKNKLNSFLLVSGITLGLTCFLLMGFYVRQEATYDQFHSKKDRIYRVWLKEDYGGDQIFFNSSTPVIFESFLEDNFPEVERAIQVNNIRLNVGEGDNRYNERVSVISKDFFDVLDFTILSSETDEALPDRNSLILSAEYAKKYFGTENPLGKSLPLELSGENRLFTITALFEDIPVNSSIQMDMAISSENDNVIYSERQRKAWFNVSPETYVLFHEGTDLDQVNAKSQDIILSVLQDEVQRDEYNIGFQPITDIHLNTEIPPALAPVGNPSYVFVLSIIGLLVLIIAIINYATLSLGHSFVRRREIGIRKVIGARKGGIIWQYLTESWLIAAVGTAISILLTYISLPLFNELIGVDITLEFQWWHIFLYLGIVCIVGISAGIYPAIVLSREQVTNILGGHGGHKKAHHLRKGMVTFQFIVTVFLVTSTLLMQRQLNFLNSKNLGFSYESTLSIQLNQDPNSQRFTDAMASARDKGKIFKSQLNQYPEILATGVGSHSFGTGNWGRVSYTDQNDIFHRFRINAIDQGYLETFNIKMKEGRSFIPDNLADEKTSIILNQAAVDHFGLSDPIGKKLPGSDFGDHKIVGITEDFNYSSLHSQIEPLILIQDYDAIYQGIHDHDYDDSPVPKLVVKYRTENLSEIYNLIEKEWKAAFPNEELRLSFTDENIQAQYESEQKMNRLVRFATLLSILVASFGLLGMTILLINSKIKEISIRKVIGASELTLFALLARSFAPQLIIGILLSVPLTILFMTKWLENFAYQIQISPLIFLAGAVISSLIALLVISYHTLKAARVNPVESMRRE